MKTSSLPSYVQCFFTERLMAQLRASPHTIASYRDTFRLLLRYACEKRKRRPTDLLVADIDAELIGGFLTFIEQSRGNSARTRNVRLAAIRSFFQYVALAEPQLLHHCQRILAMPSKRHEKRPIDYLTRSEIEALVAAPDPATWNGRRDRALLILAVQTGLRVSELIALRLDDVAFGTGAHVRCLGKGRKERSTPLRKDCVEVLRNWVRERHATADAPVFVSNRGAALSRDAVELIVRKHTTAAATRCVSLRAKKVTPHVLRHSTAMELLQNGVDRTVIALWLGHESVETTQIYIHANVQMKERALATTSPIETPTSRYRPDDELLAFLESL